MISKVNAQLSLDARRLDDALSIAAYQGEQALAGVEVEIDLAEMDAELKTTLAEAGLATQKEIAALDREQRAWLNSQNIALQRQGITTTERVSILGAVATIVEAWLMS